MNIVIVEDDRSVCFILEQIIDDRKLGKVCNVCTNPKEGQEVILTNNPDIVLIDLLMPGLDGISLVKNCRSNGITSSFIMISQVNLKNIIEKAYENGVEFYINKPINAVEVEKIISKVTEKINLRKKLARIEAAFGVTMQNCCEKEESDPKRSEYEKEIEDIMKRIGIVGEAGCKDISDIISYIIENNLSMSQYTLKDLLTIFNENYKSLEQRIRRTTFVGLRNLANLGIEDYMNDTFSEYSTSLYSFEEIKKEMDYIRGRRKQGGKVNVKKFLEGILIYCRK